MGHMPIEQAALEAAGQASVIATAAPSPDPIDPTKIISTREGHPGVVAQRFSDRIEQLLQPFTLDLDQWAEALFDVREFPESDPDDQAAALLASILLAETSAEALAAMEMNRAKEMCGGEPGGHSPLLIITGARPLRSTFEDGPSCYLIIDAVIKADGRRIRVTTGAKAVQAVILAHIARGWLPFEAMFEIRRVATRRGFYPLNLVAGG